MKKKRIILGVCCLLMMFVVTGCGKKIAKTTSDFVNVVEDYECNVTNVIEQYKDYKHVKEANVGRNKDGWQVEFYIIDNVEDAQSMFETNKQTFEAFKKGNPIEEFVTTDTYTIYSLTSGDYYMHLCRIDNTLLYARVKIKYKDTVNKLINQFGY